MTDIDTAALVEVLKGDVVTPGHLDYAEAISRWASNSERKAKAVAFVKNNEDVVSAIKFARANGLPIAVRGGGHHVGGASSIENGLVIDLSRYLDGVTVDPSKKLAYVGGGAVWATVDKEGIKHGLATVAGTVNHPSPWGGYGWLTAAHGLAIDNLVQATVVTADGSILVASNKDNEDLFFAIRGGGVNFGVVTEFVFQLYPQRPTIYAGTLIFAPPALEKLIQVTDIDEGMLQMTTVGPDGNPVIALFVFYNGTESEGRARFKPFFDIGPVADMTKERPYEELNALQNPMTGPGKAVYWKGVANKRPHHPSIAKAHEKITELNATAFRREMVNNVLINITWDHKIQDRTEEARKTAHEIADIITGHQSEMTNSEILGYSNYDPDSAAPMEKAAVVIDKAKLVFGENYPRLQAIKKRYDPDNVFNKWFPIMPA
ncbi:hypothetical protein BDZ97DRAFT_1935235 [Flammula alnicola]|nr:hypothetical protein BDZ97DRAFT_1935235 [Flammula alnicola]